MWVFFLMLLFLQVWQRSFSWVFWSWTHVTETPASEAKHSHTLLLSCSQGLKFQNRSATSMNFYAALCELDTMSFDCWQKPRFLACTCWLLARVFKPVFCCGTCVTAPDRKDVWDFRISAVEMFWSAACVFHEKVLRCEFCETEQKCFRLLSPKRAWRLCNVRLM